MESNTENVIEWITGARYVTATYTERKFINRITAIYLERPKEFKKFIKNKDGSVCATFPKKWVKNNPGSATNAEIDPDQAEKPKKTLTEEQKAKMQAGRKKKAASAKKQE